jgi:23S rRNA (pseudouridine1915-N3)-methyltransferase
MKIRILTVGKIKEKFYRDAIAEYQKRLGRYCKLEIVEVADEKTDENASPSQMEQVKDMVHLLNLKKARRFRLKQLPHT